MGVDEFMEIDLGSIGDNEDDIYQVTLDAQGNNFISLDTQEMKIVIDSENVLPGIYYMTIELQDFNSEPLTSTHNFEI